MLDDGDQNALRRVRAFAREAPEDWQVGITTTIGADTDKARTRLFQLNRRDLRRIVKLATAWERQCALG